MSIPKVLLADDNEKVRSALPEILQLHNFEVVTASGVNEALHCIGAERFDVLLSDLPMAGLGDGLTVVSAMRHANPQVITLVLNADQRKLVREFNPVFRGEPPGL